MSKYQRKNLLKCTVITGSVKVVDFDGLFFDSNFYTVNVIFG